MSSQEWFWDQGQKKINLFFILFLLHMQGATAGHLWRLSFRLETLKKNYIVESLPMKRGLSCLAYNPLHTENNNGGEGQDFSPSSHIQINPFLNT